MKRLLILILSVVALIGCEKDDDIVPDIVVNGIYDQFVTGMNNHECADGGLLVRWGVDDNGDGRIGNLEIDGFFIACQPPVGEIIFEIFTADELNQWNIDRGGGGLGIEGDTLWIVWGNNQTGNQPPSNELKHWLGMIDTGMNTLTSVQQ